ncbi:LLM class flavin-dependent oxidoreductase [Nocardia xishanensis]|uniref:LLM class flavin-dependent oxidoreductase n=1 Tax=Nocardia xishanensis TaxID=238964 RepID=UPI00341A8495
MPSSAGWASASAPRGRRANQAIDVLRLLWPGCPDGVDHHGEFFAFDKLCSYPKPFVATDLPIHVGGSSRAAARRAGLRGNGYFADGILDEDERDLQIDLARKAAVEAGRDPADLEYTRWESAELTVERVGRLAERGVTRVVVNVIAATADEQHDQMSALAERFGLPPDIRPVEALDCPQLGTAEPTNARAPRRQSAMSLDNSRGVIG